MNWTRLVKIVRIRSCFYSYCIGTNVIPEVNVGLLGMNSHSVSIHVLRYSIILGS